MDVPRKHARALHHNFDELSLSLGTISTLNRPREFRKRL